MAIDAAVLLPAGLDEAAAARLRERLQAVGISETRQSSLRKEIAERRKQLKVVPTGPNEWRVRDILPEERIPEHALIPVGWEMSVDGICRRGTEMAPIISAPVVISQMLLNVGDGTESHRLLWLRDVEWRELVVGRDVVSDSRSIVALAAHGFPVTSVNASEIVQFLANFERENLSVIPRARVT